jgi:spoIIIJ-associated protein
MDSVEAEGDSIDAAINAALKVLGTTRDRVEIEILANASRGIFGIGSRKARVRAAVRPPISADAAEPPVVAATAPRTHPATANSAAAAPVRTANPAPIDDGTGVRAAKILEEIVKHIGVEATVTIGAEDGHLLLNLVGDSSGVLIGRRGQMLDALEYLINRIVGRDEGASRLLVDSENYRARRRESLEEMARRMGDHAKRKGKPVTLNPMSPHDRRIVHLILQDDTSLTTKSSGKGYFRRLIIIPEGAPRVARPRRQDDGGSAGARRMGKRKIGSGDLPNGPD